MNRAEASPPDAVLSTRDPGDETALRYRYQWTYAAIICCMLLDDTEDVAEVFCEHHEDVLLKHKDLRFTGLQVKTRAADQEPWKTSDDGIRKAYARFARLEAEFPGHFRGFSFLTNHPLYAAANGKSICHVLGVIKAAGSLTAISGPAAKFLTRVASDASCLPQVAFVALSKSGANHDLPKFADIDTRLVTTLCQIWLGADDCTHGSLVRAARFLASACADASSLAHQNVLPAYLPCKTDSQTAELAARIEGKCIRRPRVLEILNDSLTETAALCGEGGAFVEPGVGTKSLLLKKLDAGGFSAVS